MRRWHDEVAGPLKVMSRGRRTRGGALGVEARAAAPAVTVRVIASPTYAKSFFSACPLGTARAQLRSLR